MHTANKDLKKIGYVVIRRGYYLDGRWKSEEGRQKSEDVRP